MSFRPTHEIHRRRFSRNLGVGLALIGFAAIVFGLTMAKVLDGNAVEGFDHVVRPALTEGSDQ